MASGHYYSGGKIYKNKEREKSMKILVTGGAGYIGSILIPRLLTAGHLVTVVDNFMYNQTTLLQHCISSNFRVIRGDIFGWENSGKIYDDYDLIIPLACLTGAPLSEYDRAKARIVNQEAIEAMSRVYNGKIIYPTTNSGYGISSSEMCTEESPLNPISWYGETKAEAEKAVREQGNSICLRLATAFGVSPRMRLDLLVNDLTYRAVHDKCITVFEGHFRRNFIHVQDICGAIEHCIRNWEAMKNQVYNVGLSSANLTKLELAHKIATHVPGCEVVEVAGGKDPDKRDYLVSNEKLEATGWKAHFTLDDGIKELIKAYQIIKRNQYANI